MSKNDENFNQQPSLRGAVAGTGSSYQEALFGLMGGIVYGLTSPLVGHPLDTIKTKMVRSHFHNNVLGLTAATGESKPQASQANLPMI